MNWLRRVLYLLGLVEKSVETIDGIIRRVQKDVTKAQEIAKAIKSQEGMLEASIAKATEEKASIRLERKKAEKLQENIQNTILKGIE